MTILHAKLIGKKAVLPRTELNQIIEIARRSEDIKLELLQDEVPTTGIMQLAEQGGAFDWLSEEEDLYTINDLKVRYR